MNPEVAFNITFSDAASEYIKKKCDEDNGIGFRLSVKKTGCSGFSYVPSIVTEINNNDIHFELPVGIKVYIDSAWLELLSGIKVDYVEENKLGLKQKKLIFINPQESGRCGCGESFHLE